LAKHGQCRRAVDPQVFITPANPAFLRQKRQSMSKQKRNIGLEILQGLQEIKRGKYA
jgi:hypothetical protein